MLILASSEGITSGRKINTKLLFDTRYQKLMNYETPSYHLINDFKRKSHQIISDLFVDCVKFAQYYQFLDLSTIAIDGSKIRANASKSKILKWKTSISSNISLNKKKHNNSPIKSKNHTLFQEKTN
ncbi:hypothetical protein [Methanobrevibacter intestini]|uniref:hypothetical protein n=1 Tax=Methanobrevibacter intestini TaxID=2911853 RepID=UPI003D0311D2